MKNFIEPSEGSHIQDLNDEKIVNTVKRVGKDLSHCILNLEDGTYLQTAGENGALIFQCSDGESSRSDYSTEEIAAIFIKANNKDASWKKDVFGADWEPIALREDPSVETSENVRRNVSGSNVSDIVKDGVKHAMRREARYGVSRVIGRFLRRILRGRF